MEGLTPETGRHSDAGNKTEVILHRSRRSGHQQPQIRGGGSDRDKQMDGEREMLCLL